MTSEQYETAEERSLVARGAAVKKLIDALTLAIEAANELEDCSEGYVICSIATSISYNLCHEQRKLQGCCN